VADTYGTSERYLQNSFHIVVIGELLSVIVVSVLQSACFCRNSIIFTLLKSSAIPDRNLSHGLFQAARMDTKHSWFPSCS